MTTTYPCDRPECHDHIGEHKTKTDTFCQRSLKQGVNGGWYAKYRITVTFVSGLLATTNNKQYPIWPRKTTAT